MYAYGSVLETANVGVGGFPKHGGFLRDGFLEQKKKSIPETEKGGVSKAVHVKKTTST